MNYQRKYVKKKKQTILELENAFLKSFDLLGVKNVILTSIDFEDGRDEDDFLVVYLMTDDEKIKSKIRFWINFWIGFEFKNNDFFIFYENSKNNCKELKKQFEYKKDSTLQEIIQDLVRVILSKR